MTAKELEETFRKYAWDYFAVHAAQRMAAFQFFITLATAIVGAFIALIGAGGQKWMSVLGMLLTMLAFVFYKLDCRTKELIKNAEAALSHLDTQHALPDVHLLPSPLRLIDRDRVSCEMTERGGFLRKRYSYSKCFSIIFCTFGVLGIAAAVVSAVVFPLPEKREATQRAVGKIVNITTESSARAVSKGDRHGDE